MTNYKKEYEKLKTENRRLNNILSILGSIIIILLIFSIGSGIEITKIEPMGNMICKERNDSYEFVRYIKSDNIVECKHQKLEKFDGGHIRIVGD